MTENATTSVLIRGASVAGDSVILGLRRFEIRMAAEKIGMPRPEADPEYIDSSPFPQAGVDAGGEPFMPAVETVPTVNPLPQIAEATEAAARAAWLSAEQIEAERKEILERARREGLEEGLQEARRQLIAQREEDARKLLWVLDAIPDALDRKLVQMEEELADLAFMSVCKMLGAAMQDRTLALAAVRQVLASIKSARWVRVGLAPEDLNTLSSHLDLAALLPAGVALTVEADASVSLGGCIVATDAGEWDGRLETQLARLHHALRAASFTVPRESET